MRYYVQRDGEGAHKVSSGMPVLTNLRHAVNFALFRVRMHKVALALHRDWGDFRPSHSSVVYVILITPFSNQLRDRVRDTHQRLGNNSPWKVIHQVITVGADSTLWAARPSEVMGGWDISTQCDRIGLFDRFLHYFAQRKRRDDRYSNRL